MELSWHAYLHTDGRSPIEIKLPNFADCRLQTSRHSLMGLHLADMTRLASRRELSERSRLDNRQPVCTATPQRSDVHPKGKSIWFGARASIAKRCHLGRCFNAARGAPEFSTCREYAHPISQALFFNHLIHRKEREGGRVKNAPACRQLSEEIT